MDFLDKIGTNKKVIKILRDGGWKGKEGAFAMQKHRGRFMTDVALILWEYCQKHKIQVSRKDFYKGE